MIFVIIALVAFTAAMLTFFSGFGLGTILTPAFIIFFPPEIAITLTAIVHFLNNVFKLGIIGKHVDFKVAAIFGIPAVIGAYIGSSILFGLSDLDHPISLNIINQETSVLKLIIGVLIFLFALAELVSFKKKIQTSKSWLVPGGLISGFFGGLSGHQGALRSGFLIGVGLTKEAFVATGVIIACFIDFTRITNYAIEGQLYIIKEESLLLLLAVVCAMVGSVSGKKLLKKITVDLVQKIVAYGMMLLAIFLGLGII